MNSTEKKVEISTTPQEYSVIITAKQSPLSLIDCIAVLLIMALFRMRAGQ